MTDERRHRRHPRAEADPEALPPVEFADIPPPPHSARSPAKTAALTVLCLVLILAVGGLVWLAVRLTRDRQRDERDASQPVPALANGDPTAPSATAALTPAAGVPPAPPAAADGAGVAPFVGEWDGMRETVVIDGTAHAHFHYMDSRSCPNCVVADMPYNTMDFVLTSVSNGVASGTVTASSGTRKSQIGQRVIVTLKPQPSGRAIGWSIGGLDEGLYCAPAIANWCGA
jgi:hypothetical protein